MRSMSFERLSGQHVHAEPSAAQCTGSGRRRWRLLAPCLTAVLAAGCFNSASVKLTPEQVIWTPQNEFGRQARSHLMADFRQIVSEVQSSRDIGNKVNMRPEGLMVGFDKEHPSVHFTALDLDYLAPFDAAKTTFLQRAAGAYSAVLYGLARILADHPALFNEPGLSGFGMTLRWKSTDPAGDRFGLAVQTETMDAIIPADVLRDFAASKISIHVLSERSRFLSLTGQTELDFTNLP